MKAKAWFAAAAAGAALCLALPFAVFAVWDRALTARPQPLPADDPALAGLLSAEGRADETACLLYAAAHVFGVELSPLDLSGGWTQAAEQTLPPDTVRAALAGESAAAENAWSAAAQQAAQIAQDLRAAGLLAEDCWQAVADGWDGTVTAECYTAPGGLARLRLWDENTNFDMAWTPQGVPVYVSLYDAALPLGEAVTPGLLDGYLALAGLDEAFGDWQTIDWSARLPAAGETAYSPAAQLYATASARDGLTLTLQSLPPDTVAKLAGGEGEWK